MSNGKGDTPRPISVSTEQFGNNWERTFGSTKKKIDQKIHDLQEDIDRVKDMLDHYSGLPSTQSYDDTTYGETNRDN